YVTWLPLRVANTYTNVSGPRRPKYMYNKISVWLGIDSSAVIPSPIPVVLMAEATSKKTLLKGSSSKSEIKNIHNITQVTVTKTKAKAFWTVLGAIVRCIRTTCACWRK